MKTINKICYLLTALFLLASLKTNLLAQNQGVSINATNAPPHNSAMLDVSSTNKGVLISRMTQAQRNAIASPAEGLMIYQTDSKEGFYYFSNGIWMAVGNNSTPTGGIIMYSGAWNFNATGLGTGELTGWALCNGNNGTPNLSDKFVMGTTTSGTINQTGGNNNMTLTISNLPSHSHPFSIGSSGSHSHTYYKLPMLVCTQYMDIFCTSSNSGIKNIYGNSSSTESSYTISGGSHTHSGTTNLSGSGTAFENRPAFVKLAYIMKL